MQILKLELKIFLVNSAEEKNVKGRFGMTRGCVNGVRVVKLWSSISLLSQIEGKSFCPLRHNKF